VENSMEIPQLLKVETLYNAATFLMSTYPKEMKFHI
jgi:hypothetical protein